MSAPFLAIATKSFKGVARGSKVEGMKNPGTTKTRKAAHVGMFERREIPNKADVNRPRIEFREVENFAEFDGPTCVDACNSFLSLALKGAARSVGKCVADGRQAPVKLWKKLDSVEAKNINLPDSFLNPKASTPIHIERHPIFQELREVAS